jgi:hypothetical protein
MSVYEELPKSLIELLIDGLLRITLIDCQSIDMDVGYKSFLVCVVERNEGMLSYCNKVFCNTSDNYYKVQEIGVSLS